MSPEILTSPLTEDEMLGTLKILNSLITEFKTPSEERTRMIRLYNEMFNTYRDITNDDLREK